MKWGPPRSNVEKPKESVIEVFETQDFSVAEKLSKKGFNVDAVRSPSIPNGKKTYVFKADPQKIKEALDG